MDMFVWRPILAQIATLQEIETHWGMLDLISAHEALDIQHDAEQHSMKKAQENR